MSQEVREYALCGERGTLSLRRLDMLVQDVLDA